MNAAKAKSNVIWEEPPLSPPRGFDFEVLGAALKTLPPVYWEADMLFRNAPDRALQSYSCGFPATLSKDRLTHPLFVLQTLPNLGHQVCPCSSKNFSSKRFIRCGCKLLYTNRQTDRNSYLVEAYRFNLPLDPEFTSRLRFMGRVPAECLESCTHGS